MLQIGEKNARARARVCLRERVRESERNTLDKFRFYLLVLGTIESSLYTFVTEKKNT